MVLFLFTNSKMPTLTTADYLLEAKSCFRQIFNDNAPFIEPFTTNITEKIIVSYKFTID